MTIRLILAILLAASFYSGALALHGIELVVFGLAWGLTIFLVTAFLMRR